MLSDNTKSYLHLHLIVFIWGFTAILGALISLEALPLVWFRMLFALIFVLIYLLVKKISFKVTVKLFLCFLLAGFIIALHWFTFFKAIKVANISVTLSCLSSGAFFVSILEPLLNQKKVIWYEVFFGCIVFFGLYIIFKFENDYFEGIILALTSAFFSALFSILNSKFAKIHNPTVITFYELLGGVLFFSIILLFNNNFTTQFFVFTSQDFIYLLLLSTICTAYAFIVSVKVMKYLSAYTVVLTTNLEPLYGIVLAVLLFKDKEKMSTNFYFGAMLILIIVFLNAYIKNKNVQK